MCRYVGTKFLIASRPASGRENVFSVKILFITCFDERNSFHSFEVFLWCELIKTLTLTCFLSMTRDPFWCSSFLFKTGYLSSFSISTYRSLFSEFCFTCFSVLPSSCLWDESGRENFNHSSWHFRLWIFGFVFCVFLFVFICILIRKRFNSWE